MVIRSWKHEEILYAIFHRLNSGSVPLSPQELRQALHPGPFVSFAAHYSEASRALKLVLRLSRPDFRMRDVELLIRFFAFYNYLHLYAGNLKSFLDDTCKRLNKFWSTHDDQLMIQATQFEDAISAAEQIFGSRTIFRRWDGRKFERPLNRALFDVITVSFANKEIRDACLARTEEVLAAFKELCTEEEFRRAIETTTKSKDAVSTRFRSWYRLLRRVTHQEFRVTLWD